MDQICDGTIKMFKGCNGTTDELVKQFETRITQKIKYFATAILVKSYDNEIPHTMQETIADMFEKFYVKSYTNKYRANIESD